MYSVNRVGKFGALISTGLSFLTIIFIVLNLLPGGFVRDIVSFDHFLSSQHLFEYASKHHFLFGTDIIDNVGPYGYLHYPYTFTGDAYWSKTLWYVLLCCVYAYYAKKLMQGMTSWLERCLFLFAIVFFPLQSNSPWASFEIIPRLTLLFSALYFLNPRSNTLDDPSHVAHLKFIMEIILTSLLYAFLLLEKVGNVYFIFIIVPTLTGYWVLTRQYRLVAWMLGTLCIGVISFWLAASQSIAGLPTYFQSINQFVDAYQQTFSADIKSSWLHYAVAFCIITLFAMGLRLYTAYSLHTFFSESLRGFLITVFVYIMWKHGMTRGIDSYNILLCGMPSVFAYLLFYPVTNFTTQRQRTPFIVYLITPQGYLIRSGLFIVLLILVCFRMHSSVQTLTIINEFRTRYLQLSHYHPFERYHQLQTKFISFKQDYTLSPELQQILRQAKVDEFGNAPEMILLNNLNYQPRPIPIHFIVTNAVLNQKNLHYYQNPRTAPNYVFLPDFGFQVADTAAYLSLIFNYQIHQSIHNWLLLQKKPSWQHIHFKSHSILQAQLGKWIILPAYSNNFLWATVDIQSSVLGHLKQWLYKSDFVLLELAYRNGTHERYRISPGALRSGLLINPVIESKDSLKFRYYQHQPPWDRVHAFRIVLEQPEKQRFFQSAMKVALFDIQTHSKAAPPSTVTLEKANHLIQLFDPNVSIKPVDLPIDLLHLTPGWDLGKHGLSSLVHDGWAIGPKTTISFYINKLLPQYLLNLKVENALNLSNQQLHITCNGKILQHVQLKDTQEIQLKLPIKKGMNHINITYYDWNHKHHHYVPNDPRQLAVLFKQFLITTNPPV